MAVSTDEMRRRAYMEKHWPSLAKEQQMMQPEQAAPKMRDGLVEPPWMRGDRRDYCDHWWHGQFWHVRKSWHGRNYWEYDAASGFAATFIAVWLCLAGGLGALIGLAAWVSS